MLSSKIFHLDALKQAVKSEVPPDGCVVVLSRADRADQPSLKLCTSGSVPAASMIAECCTRDREGGLCRVGTPGKNGCPEARPALACSLNTASDRSAATGTRGICQSETKSAANLPGLKIASASASSSRVYADLMMV